MAHECEDYLAQVGAQIRWPRARTYLLEELSHHLTDQRAALEEEGVSPEEAERRAVTDMGDPAAVGKELNALHRPALSLAPAFLALGIGLVGGALIPGLVGGSALRYWLGFVLGLGLMALLRLSDLGGLIRRRGGWLSLVMALALVLTVAVILGSPRLPIGPSPLWPLYLCLFFPLLFALLLLRLRGMPGKLLCFLSLWMYALAIPALLVPNLTTALLLGGTMLLTATVATALGWFGGKRWVGLISLWAPTVLLMGLFFSAYTSIPGRLQFFFHPEQDPMGYGWQTLLMRDILWKGSEEAAAEYLSIPLSQYPDISLLTLSARLGRPVMAAALGIILLFAVVCLWRMGKLRSTSGKLLALSLFLPLFFQAIAYWLYNAALFPFSSSLPLPFFSYGPTGMVVDFALLGLLLSVFRMDPLQRDGPRCQLQFSTPEMVKRLYSLVQPADEHS